MDKLSSLFKREVSCIAWEKILLSNEIDLQLFICIGRLHIVSCAISDLLQMQIFLR